MNLTQSLHAFGTDRFATLLHEALTRDMNALPLERGCDSGGWPKDFKVSTNFANLHEDESTIAVDFSVYFTEARSTGCSATTTDMPRVLQCRVSICKQTGEGEIIALEDDDEPEF